MTKRNIHYVFGQKIGSKVGNTVTEGCCFPWCSLQNSFYLFSYPSCRRTSTSSNNGFAAPSNRKCNKSDPDEEEYYCLRPTGTASKPTVVATASTRGHHNKNDRLASSTLTSDDRNPDVIPGSGGIHVNIHAPGMWLLRLRKKCIVRMMADRKHMAFLRRVFIAEKYILVYQCMRIYISVFLQKKMKAFVAEHQSNRILAALEVCPVTAREIPEVIRPRPTSQPLDPLLPLWGTLIKWAFPILLRCLILS